MITNIQPDKQKASSLQKSAEKTLERLNYTEKEKFPTNTLTDYYDIIHKLLEAITLAEGIKINGEGAHQELIDYVIIKNSLGTKMQVFLQQMRDYRNRASYEGFNVNSDYITANNSFILEIINKLKDVLKEKGI